MGLLDSVAQGKQCVTIEIGVLRATSGSCRYASAGRFIAVGCARLALVDEPRNGIPMTPSDGHTIN